MIPRYRATAARAHFDAILQPREAHGAKDDVLANDVARRAGEPQRAGQFHVLARATNFLPRRSPRWLRAAPCRAPDLLQRRKPFRCVAGPGLPRSSRWKARYFVPSRSCMRTATATRAASRTLGPRTGNSLSTIFRFELSLSKSQHIRQGPLAEAAIVVEELDEGDSAVRISKRHLMRRTRTEAPRHLATAALRSATVFAAVGAEPALTFAAERCLSSSAGSDRLLRDA